MTQHLGKIAIALALGLFGAVVTRDLYIWFAVPLGAPVLSLAHVYGLGLLKGILTYRQGKDDADLSVSSLLIFYLLCWGLGAIAAGFMA